MKPFIKENAALVVALALPILFACFFYVSKNMVTEKGPAPQYDFIVSNNYHDQNFDVEVINGTLSVQFIYPVKNDRGQFPQISRNRAELYYVDADTMIAEPLNFALPDDARNPPPEKEGQAVDIKIDKTDGLNFSAATIAPDGYTFRRSDYRSGNILTEIYSSRSNGRNSWVLDKDGSIYKIKGLDHYNLQVLGWVLDGQGKNDASE